MVIDFCKLKTYPLRTRKSKVKIEKFSSLNFLKKDFFSSLPDILAGKDFKQLISEIIQAKRKERAIIFMLGAHVIKCGLSPFIIDLMRRRIITAVALNGAGIIHDFEIAYQGGTSEDVDEAIQNGSFGMASETADYLNRAIKEGRIKNYGLGEAIGKMIARRKLKYRAYSLLYAGVKYQIPVTVHVAIGTDIIHMHPSCNGADTGELSLRDFRRFCEVVSKLGKGVVINFGSAVILPEVFLKALAVVRNLGFGVKNFTSADFDMIKHYRAFTNVVKRPTLEGKGFSFIGHHEIMLPLLYRAIMERMCRDG
ncbi:MAG: hypothetical protein NC818_05435 [Candidatus Omnitrophica bacterium]|nr:hypothetical protein [Candidatus Omnitrophota bacterium]